MLQQLPSANCPVKCKDYLSERCPAEFPLKLEGRSLSWHEPRTWCIVSMSAAEIKVWSGQFSLPVLQKGESFVVVATKLGHNKR